MSSTMLLDECSKEGGAREPLRLGMSVIQGVPLSASVATRGKRIDVGRGDFVATMPVALGEPLKLIVGMPGGSDRVLVQALGDICILGPGSTLMIPSGPGEIIQYRMPAALIREGGAQWNLGGVDSLICPMVCGDKVLHRLSRVMSRLLELPGQSTSSIDLPFANSFYAHLLQQYGIRSGGGSECVGGFSPRHRRIVASIFAAPFAPDLSIAEVARRCGLSRGHFARAFRQAFGRPFHQYVRKLRLDRVRELLKRSELSIAEIARESGYADQATFTESFRRASGVAPGRYRRQHAWDERRRCTASSLVKDRDLTHA